jgi:hypothetical protein
MRLRRVYQFARLCERLLADTVVGLDNFDRSTACYQKPTWRLLPGIGSFHE